MQRVFANGFVDNSCAFPVGDLAHLGDKIFLAANNRVMAAGLSRDFRLLFRADRTDDRRSKRFRPLAEDKPHAAGSGMQLLQLMLSAGLLLTFIRFWKVKGFWWMAALLPPMVWFTNTIRISVITAWALGFGPDSAAGAFHTWGALILVSLMMIIYIPVSGWIRKFCNPTS